MRNLILFTVLVFLFTGCMSILRDKESTISIITNPPGANVSFHGKSGVTPTTLRVPREEGIMQISKEGYQTQSLPIKVSQNGWAWFGSLVLNASHGFFTIGITYVAGVGSDIASGSLQDFSQDNMEVNLVPGK